MIDRALRAKLIRLAHARPELRAELLPLLKTAIPGMNPLSPMSVMQRALSKGNEPEPKKKKTEPESDSAPKDEDPERFRDLNRKPEKYIDPDQQEESRSKNEERAKSKAEKGEQQKQNRKTKLKNKGDKRTKEEESEHQDNEKEDKAKADKADKAEKAKAAEEAEKEKAKETAKNQFEANKEKHPKSEKTVGDFFKDIWGKITGKKAAAELRSATIRLAHSKPELRAHLLPLLKTAASPLDRVRGHELGIAACQARYLVPTHALEAQVTTVERDMNTSALRVAHRFMSLASLRLGAGLAVPVTSAYLKRVLDFMVSANEDENSEWKGSWSNFIPDFRRLATRSLEDTKSLWGSVPTVAEVMDRMRDQGLHEVLIQQVLDAVPLPKAPRPPPTQDQTKADFAKVVDSFRETLPPSASLNVRHEHEATPGKAKDLKAWTRAFKTVKAKYPQVWAVLSQKLRVIVLEVRPTGTASAAWSLQLLINLNDRPLSSYAGTLVHEVGHMFEDLQPDQHDIQGWQGLYGNPPFSHNYLKERPVEDFAECYRQFFTEPSLLKRLAPAKYADMAARI